MSDQKSLLPKLRFPEFKNDWEQKKMNSLFIIKAGGDVDSKNYSKTKTTVFKYPIYANAEKRKGLFGFSDVFKFEGETLTIAGRGVNIGVAHARNERFFPIVRLLVLQPKQKENVKFFEYQFNRQNIFVESTGVPQLTAPQVSTYSVYKTQLPEQQKIATFLTAVDEKINLLQKKKEGLEQYKKGVMQQLFSQKLRFKKEDGNDYPDWEEKKLGEIFKSLKGKGISKGQTVNEGKYQCILYGELYTKYSEVIAKVISSTNDDDGIKSKVGDLLIPGSTTTTGIDLANVTALNFDNIRLGGDIIVLRGNIDKINNLFFAYYLTNYKKNEIAARAQGITIVHIYFSSIEDLKIDLPSKQEQTKISNFLNNIDNKITFVETQLGNTKQFKKGLLQQMFV